MNKEILKSLKEIESKYDIKVLYACESGSRAWGFPSPDSDYDVRFIYAHNPKWYFSLGEKKDTLNLFLPNDLDVSGWEIRKTFTQFAKSNASLYEWFDSPIVYCDCNDFCEKAKNFIPKFFNPRKAMYHYSNLARRASEKLFTTNSISIKKLMYALRTLLACEWILQKSTMPPTSFQKIYQEIASEDLQIQIEKLIKEKEKLGELSETKVEDTVRNFIENNTLYFNQAQELPAVSDADFTPLNNIIFDLIK